MSVLALCQKLGVCTVFLNPFQDISMQQASSNVWLGSYQQAGGLNDISQRTRAGRPEGLRPISHQNHDGSQFLCGIL